MIRNMRTWWGLRSERVIGRRAKCFLCKVRPGAQEVPPPTGRGRRHGCPLRGDWIHHSREAAFGVQRRDPSGTLVWIRAKMVANWESRLQASQEEPKNSPQGKNNGEGDNEVSV